MYTVTYINKDGLTLQKVFTYWYQVNNFISCVDWLRIEDLEYNNEPDCKVCLEPQYCECNCGTCSDSRAIYLESIEESELNETTAQIMMDEISNDIEKDGQ